MAVKASANITLHSVVDIQATYRYYLLQSSTLAKPAVPTTNPPGTAWGDAEPTYTPGSTSSLYYVDLTVFSNGTFRYSEVSLSTAYEAAKEAYNRAMAAQNAANNAQEDVDNLNIGGRNLLRYTDITRHSSNWTIWGGGSSSVVANDYLKITPLSTSTSSGAYPAHSASLENGVEYTISFEAYSDAAIALNYCYIMCESGNSSLGISIPISTTAGRYTHTFTTSKAYDSCSIMLGCSGTAGALKPLYIRNLKLERGNRATDWTAAPEDTDDAVNDAQNTANTNSGRIDSAESSIVKLENMIAMLVTGSNGESLMTQTEDGWVFSMASFIESMNNATNSVGDLTSSVSNTNQQLDELHQSVVNLGQYTEYISFTTLNGQPAIVLGETDSEFKVVITNTDIRFMQGTDTPAYISNQSLNIKKAVVEDELKQGGFVWMARDNGNYGLLWKGE